MQTDLYNITDAVQRAEIQRKVAAEFYLRLKTAGLADLLVLENRLTRHYGAGTLSEKDFAALDVAIMEELARHDNQ